MSKYICTRKDGVECASCGNPHCFSTENCQYKELEPTPLGEWTLQEVKAECAKRQWCSAKDEKPCPFCMADDECRIGSGKSPDRFKLTEEVEPK